MEVYIVEPPLVREWFGSKEPVRPLYRSPGNRCSLNSAAVYEPLPTGQTGADSSAA